MGISNQVEPGLKLSAVREYLAGSSSLNKTAEKYGIYRSTLQKWLLNYELFDGVKPRQHSRTAVIDLHQLLRGKKGVAGDQAGSDSEVLLGGGIAVRTNAWTKVIYLI